jgi:hypothetical protein
MPLMRFSVACLVALMCLGSSYAGAVDRPPAKPAKPAAQIVVEICAGDSKNRDNCGPGKGFSGRRLGEPPIPEIAQRAGSLSASGPMNFKCPGPCQGKAKRAVTVTIKAVAARDGYHKFLKWEGACVGTVPTCRVRVQGSMTVTAFFGATN